jgi:uncharacterized membrane protein
MYNRRSSYASSTVLGIDERLERVLCYALGWVTGVIFLLIEQRNAAVRRHAYQSVVVFGALTIIWVIWSILGALGAIPVLGFFFGIGLGLLGVILSLITFVAWLGLMFLAFMSPETFIGNNRRDLI